MLNRLSIILLPILLLFAACTTFHKAAKTGDINSVKSYISKGSDVNIANKYGHTPIILAADGGHLSIVKYLVENGADLNAVCNTGDSALNKAAYDGYIEIVKYLVKQGAIIDINGDLGTALIVAAWSGHINIVKYLVENGADINIVSRHGTAIIKAAKKHHAEVVKYLASNGAKVPEGKALVALGDNIHTDGKTNIPGFKWYMGLLRPGEYTFRVKYSKTLGDYAHLVGDVMPVKFSVEAGRIYVIENKYQGKAGMCNWAPNVVT